MATSTQEVEPRPIELARRTLRGEPPEVYRHGLKHTYLGRARAALQPGMQVLDIGAGRRPSIPARQRPAGVRYVGLDLSAAELARAGPQAYDEIVVADATRWVAGLAGRFDLALSYQVFEHVESLRETFANVRSYLRPGGHMIVQFSGRRTPFALANRLVPHAVAKQLLRVLLHRNPDAVFPAPYDDCWYDAVAADLAAWQHVSIEPIHRGGTYVAFARPLQAAYVGYEAWLERTGRRNLAAYYLVDAVS